jgi:hypothetical protein
MRLSRRSFFTGLVAAPAIVRLPSLMLMPRAPWPPLIRTPDNLLLCNGALVSAKDYPELFAVVGETYGGGNGRFRLPDLRPMPFFGFNGNRPLHQLINIAPENGPIGMVVFG